MLEQLAAPVFYKQFASTYNCGAYGRGEFNRQECETTTGTGEVLPETGTPVYIGITAGVLLLVTGAVVLFTTRKGKKGSKTS